MTTYDDVVTRWMERQYFGSTKRELTSQRVFGRGDVLYSYGSHFELARILRDSKGQTRGVLLNGDNYSVSTSRHQSAARGAIYRMLYDLDDQSVIIPFQALHAAGVDPATVEIVDVTPDGRSERIEEHFELPPGAILAWEPIKDYRPLFPDEQEKALNDDFASRMTDWENEQRGAARARAGEFDRSTWIRDRSLSQWLVKRPHRRLTWEEYVAEGGTSWARASRNSVYATVGHKLTCWVNGSKNRTWDMEYLPDGRTRYQRTHVRHWLGESLVRGKVTYIRTHICRTCRGGRPVGPERRVILEETKTEWWRLADGSYDRAEYPYSEIRLIGPPRCDHCEGRGRTRTWHTRTAYFLSGFDHQEVRRCYFFCELPKDVKPTTVDEAYEALKPDPVTLAESMGREVIRQGDIFAIPTARIKRELLAAGGAHGRMVPLLGTNHAATEVITVGRLTYARGILHHVPDGRRPDHARVRLGDLWHLIVKNTVPIAA